MKATLHIGAFDVDLLNACLHLAKYTSHTTAINTFFSSDASAR